MWIAMNRRVSPLLLLAGALLASPAFAQFGGSSGQGSIAAGKAARQTPGSAESEPAALPGAQSRGAAPLTKPPSEMGPTEALFDAVNRGDIAAARDALTRGADVGGHNILGLTPLELAVDLGQNDIAFLLLSLRDADTAGRTATAGRSATASAKAAPATARPAQAVPVKTAPAARVAQQRPAPADGGTPVPNAGFLGFGGR